MQKVLFTLIGTLLFVVVASNMIMPLTWNVFDRIGNASSDAMGIAPFAPITYDKLQENWMAVGVVFPVAIMLYLLNGRQKKKRRSYEDKYSPY